MGFKNKPLILDLEDRYHDCYAVIHAEGDHLAGTHEAVAQVVVRLEGESDDRPGLVAFAQALVNRYNQHDRLLALVKALHNSDFGTLPSFDEINNLIAEAEGQNDENQN